MTERFGFLEFGNDVPPLPPENEENDTPDPEWKPSRLRCVEVIGEPGNKAGAI